MKSAHSVARPRVIWVPYRHLGLYHRGERTVLDLGRTRTMHQQDSRCATSSCFMARVSPISLAVSTGQSSSSPPPRQAASSAHQHPHPLGARESQLLRDNMSWACRDGHFFVLRTHGGDQRLLSLILGCVLGLRNAAVPRHASHAGPRREGSNIWKRNLSPRKNSRGRTSRI